MHTRLICFVLSQMLLFSRVECRCPRSFECGRLGTMSFPFSNVSDCGFYFVNCTDLYYPTVKLWAEQNWLFKIVEQHSGTLKIRYPFKNCNSFSQSFPNNCVISLTIQSTMQMLRCDSLTLSTATNEQLFLPIAKFVKCQEDYSFDIYYNFSNDRFHNFTGVIPSGCSIIKLPVENKYISPENVTELYNVLVDDWVLEYNLSESCQKCLNGGNQCEVDRFNNFQCSGERKETKFLIFIKVLAVLPCSLIIAFIICHCKKRIIESSSHVLQLCKMAARDCQNIEHMVRNFGSVVPKRYRYCHVKRMTSSFKIKLGQGGYGSVFKGMLDDNNPIAVKLLISSDGNGGEEFINEVASISRTSHVNIVKLLGYCCEGKKRALIYEFMPNGSLEKFIYNNKLLVARQLGWDTLFKISVGIARGLEYLHRGCTTRIVHFDIKPHNILLDEDFCPKISDFGLSKHCAGKESIFSLTGVRGTIGYIAPEVICKGFGDVSHKSDVYSYGMMILEMVGGRKNADDRVENDSHVYFPHWIHSKLENNQELGLHSIVDGQGNESARKMITMSLWCIQPDPSLRPTMSRVVEMLEGELDLLQIPPKPYLFSQFNSSVNSTNELI